ncbi:MAG: NAD(P)/FAD-dependent oxidoreductase [Chthoniobacterales bacterium]
MKDVAIIGGGPAGSTAATLLAREGRSVVVFEREKFPRFHIGESLLPFSMDALKRLGVMEKIHAAGFMPKHGAGISTGSGEREVQFYFKNGFRPEHATAFQVDRSRFDELLLDHAEESGAEVHQETAVTQTEFSDAGVILTARTTEGAERTVQARYLLDCSGRHAVVGQLFDLKRVYPQLKKFAIYAHYDDVDLPDGIDGTLTRMIRTENAWFWLIPLSPERTSVGVVMDTSRFRESGLSAEAMLEREIEATPAIRERLRNARLASKVRAGGDYSYRSERLSGDRWLLAGDAAGFIDPIFSSGVFLALLGGERAADALHAALNDPASAPQNFAAYSKELRSVMKLYLGFVNGWYQREFVETLLNPTEFFDVVPAVNAVLAGNLGSDFAIRWRLWVFRAVVAAQRFIPISPRVAFG